MAALLNPDLLLDVKAGLARLRVEAVRATAVAPESVFASFDFEDGVFRPCDPAAA